MYNQGVCLRSQSRESPSKGTLRLRAKTRTLDPNSTPTVYTKRNVDKTHLGYTTLSAEPAA